MDCKIKFLKILINKNINWQFCFTRLPCTGQWVSDDCVGAHFSKLVVVTMKIFNRYTLLIYILGFFFFSSTLFSQPAMDSVLLEMNRFIGQSNNNAGLLFGMYNEKTGEVSILTEGAIEKGDDLRVACPITKPCVAYMVLKEGLNLNSSINKWFTVEKGYTKADTITLRMLLYHTSGIRDFAKVIKPDPYKKVTPIETINLAYQNQPLEFIPGTQYQYSNTDYNILGTILEQTSNKSFNDLIKEYFGLVASTLRLDDGKGNYPKGYSNPWPYHWSTTGYAGGLISIAEDAMKVFSYISNSPEFYQMSEWINDSEKENHLVGMGVFAFDNFHEFGRTVYYDGDMMANQMFIIKIGNVIYYFHTTQQVMLEELINFSYKIITLIHKR
jgi:hypothetical protein